MKRQQVIISSSSRASNAHSSNSNNSNANANANTTLQFVGSAVIEQKGSSLPQSTAPFQEASAVESVEHMDTAGDLPARGADPLLDDLVALFPLPEEVCTALLCCAHAEPSFFILQGETPDTADW